MTALLVVLFRGHQGRCDGIFLGRIESHMPSGCLQVLHMPQATLYWYRGVCCSICKGLEPLRLSHRPWVGHLEYLGIHIGRHRPPAAAISFGHLRSGSVT